MDLNEDQPNEEGKSYLFRVWYSKEISPDHLHFGRLYGRQSTFLSSSLTFVIKDQEKKKQTRKKNYYHESMQIFPGGAVVKNLSANVGAAGDMGSVPGSGRSPGGGHSNPLQ